MYAFISVPHVIAHIFDVNNQIWLQQCKYDPTAIMLNGPTGQAFLHMCAKTQQTPKPT